MATIKYRTSSGEYQTLTNYSVQPITPVQTTGTSATDIMSQNAVTTELNKATTELNKITSFLEGANTTTSVASIPVTKRLCIATVSSSGSFTLASTPSAGREIHVIVKNSNSSDITITLPSSSSYNNNGVDSLTVKGSSFGEINAISDGSTIYIRTI